MTESPPAGPETPGPQSPPSFELIASRQMFDWLGEQGISLAFTTYQAGKLFFIGRQPTGQVSIFERTLNRCMGMCAAGNSLYVSTLYQLWRFENALEPGQEHNGYDRLYLPQVGWVTGDLDIHDLALNGQGQVVFANTLFSCLATVSEEYSFAPLWTPPFISRLAAEDRCHLNGIAMEGGRARYVTAVSESDVADGWREHRRDGGVVVDIATGQVAVSGLSMPHSPRMHRGKLWLHNSGTGEFGHADPATGKFQPVAFCPGYLRGLDFIGKYAVMGLSKPRGDKTFGGLALEDHLRRLKAEPRCGVHVVDLESGDVVHWLRLEGLVQELYDVAVIPGARRPMAIGFVSDEIRRVLRVAPPK